MSITETSKVDIVTVDDNDAVLIITDHLEWDGYSDDEHMYLLQEKINAYLRFYESGEIYDKFQNAKGKKVVIKIASKYTLNDTGNWFLNQIKPVIESAGLSLQFQFNGDIIELDKEVKNN